MERDAMERGSKERMMRGESGAGRETAWAPLPALEPLRTRIGDHLWEELLTGVPVVRAMAGTAIFSTGKPPRLAAVCAGLVRVFTWTGDGRQVPLRYARAGDLIGLAGLLTGTTMLSSEVVTETTLALLSMDRLRDLASAHPDLSWALMEQVAGWGTESVATVLGAGFESVRVRVARHLLDRATQTLEGEVAVQATHQALADAVGTAREVITRLLRALREEGIIDNRGGLVIVVRPEELARIARGATLR
ncbi:MAG: transcriptional regulator, Crp/Fnr family [Chloroflexi bacterium]|jgi:CRP/FNR family cyclic AMP-dependent transcriptional regulator|nr:transcriptional regulator, Crp/Fnr family [Chloroflexota bacterium]